MIYVPYTYIQPATRIALNDYEYTPVLCDDEYGYVRYFRQRWADKETFINCEHDTVFWPGAIELLLECPKPWCAYGWSTQDRFVNAVSVYLSLTKISWAMIRLLPGIWNKDIHWEYLDTHLTKCAREKGLEIHQHYPPIVNANPRILDPVAVPGSFLEPQT